MQLVRELLLFPRDSKIQPFLFLRVNEARILVGQFVGVEDVLRQHDFLVSHLFTRVFGFSASERDALMHYITTDELPQVF